jgi:hypothetical protein
MRLRALTRCERGQAIGEYTGVIVLVAAAILVMAAFAPGIAGAIADDAGQSASGTASPQTVCATALAPATLAR